MVSKEKQPSPCDAKALTFAGVKGMKTLREYTGRLARSVAVSMTMVVAGVSAQADTTLAAALEKTYITSGLLDQNRAVLRAAEEDVVQALASLRPIVSWNAQLRRRFGTSGNTTSAGFVEGGTGVTDATLGLSAQLLIWDGGRTKLSIDIAKESVLSTRADLLATEQDVLFRSVQAFMEVRRALEVVGLRENNVKLITQELRAARERFEVGEVTRTDVALAEARLAGARSQLAASQGDLARARAEYEAAVGHPPKRLRTPKGLPRIPKNAKAAEREALKKHPSLIAAQHSVTAAELNIAIAEAAKKPTVTLQGSYGVTETFQQRDYSRSGSISLNAQGPIYQGGALPSQVRQARANRDQARAALHVTGVGVVQNVANAYASLNVARASISASQQQVRASTVAFTGVREEARLGQRTTLDVLDAEQELLDARATLISAQVDETIAAYLVLASIGHLTAHKLGLSVPHYDPAAYYNLVKSGPAHMSKQGRELDRVLRALGKQ